MERLKESDKKLGRQEEGGEKRRERDFLFLYISLIPLSESHIPHFGPLTFSLGLKLFFLGLFSSFAGQIMGAQLGNIGTDPR